MEEIDWPKAPEGATHYLKDNAAYGWVACWYKYENNQWLAINDANRHKWLADNDQVDLFVPLLIPRPSPSWSGQGLPPVGVRCEAGIPHTSGPDGENRSIVWIDGRVIAYHDIKGRKYAWFADDDGGFYPPGVLEFRPIRTPEQIAKDEREAAVDAMLLLDPYLQNTQLGMMSRADFCRALYSDGYRKP